MGKLFLFILNYNYKHDIPLHLQITITIHWVKENDKMHDTCLILKTIQLQQDFTILLTYQ
jgi:hypothetical protein